MEKLKAINRRQIFKNLNCENEMVDRDTLQKIDDCEMLVLNNIHPRYMGKCFNVKNGEDRICLSDSQTRGNDIEIFGKRLFPNSITVKKRCCFASHSPVISTWR